MWTQHLAAARRAAAAIALAATVLVSPSPAVAEDPIGKNYIPEARIQIALNKIYIKHDHDWGSGEMWFQVRLNCEQVVLPCLGQPSANLDAFDRSFSASDGDTIWFNVVLPQSTERMNPSWGIELENGYPLTSYQRYTLSIHLWEKDSLSSSDNLGTIEIPVNKENGWGIGDYPLWSGDDYQIGLDIHRSPLPDLRVNSVKILDQPGSAKKLMCAGVENVGVVDAAPFQTVLEIYPADHSSVSSNSTVSGGLSRGQSGETCVEVALPPPGDYELVAAANPVAEQREFNHLDNILRQPYTVNKPLSAPTPIPSPAPVEPRARGQADLSVTAIEVNGQAPDGKNDCRDGTNDVTVTVKNTGAAKAGGFLVRLTPDDENAVEQSVNGLDAGKEREVRFENVRLKKGEHTLTLTVDSKGAVAESDEDNNSRAVTVRCSGN
jgi:hypothetical protein